MAPPLEEACPGIQAELFPAGTALSPRPLPRPVLSGPRGPRLESPARAPLCGRQRPASPRRPDDLPSERPPSSPGPRQSGAAAPQTERGRVSPSPQTPAQRCGGRRPGKELSSFPSQQRPLPWRQAPRSTECGWAFGLGPQEPQAPARAEQSAAPSAAPGRRILGPAAGGGGPWAPWPREGAFTEWWWCRAVGAHTGGRPPG